MWQQEFIWFFTLFHHEFRTNNPIAFEVLMVLAVAHLFGFYNPKQLADFLEVPHQNFYAELKHWSIYQVKKMLLRFMVNKTPYGRPRARARRMPWSRHCIRDTPAWACRRYIPHEIWRHRSPHQ